MKLISLNIEGDKHLSLSLPFFEREKPDVLCLQEVFDKDAEIIAHTLGMKHAFAPMTLRVTTLPEREGMLLPNGVAILSNSPLLGIKTNYYHEPIEGLPEFDRTSPETIHGTLKRALLSASIQTDIDYYTVATTHLTWTPVGLVTDEQEKSAEELFKLLNVFEDVILCGDFNMPRGVNTLYERFTERYVDTIPTSYASSLDPERHRASANPEDLARITRFMVDYIFITKEYRAKNVHLKSGVSDHMAVVADVERVT